MGGILKEITGLTDKSYTFTNIQNAAKIEVTGYIRNVPKATYYVLHTTKVMKSGKKTGQDLIASYVEHYTKTFSDTENIPQQTTKPDVAMQKYIIKVNDAALTTDQTSETNRSRFKTSRNETSTNLLKDDLKTWKQFLASKNWPIQEKYKLDSKVQIEQYDTVTYCIDVVNNSNVDASVLIKDRLPYYTDNNGTKQNATWLLSVKQVNVDTGEDINTLFYREYGNPVETNNINWTKEAQDGNNSLITFGNGKNNIALARGQRVKFYVTVKFTVNLTGTLTNTAWISCQDSQGNYSNQGTYRVADRDYVEIIQKKYGVSLEKFVSSVTDKDGNNKVDYVDRAGKRCNTNLAGKTDEYGNYNTYKKDKPVQVEPGDIVTFTIRLKNTGQESVKVTNIYDTFTDYDGVDARLEPIIDEIKTNDETIYKIAYGNGDGEVSNFNRDYNGDNGRGERYRRFNIHFDNPIRLGVNSSTDVKIKFKVVVGTQYTSDSIDFYNTAGITGDNTVSNNSNKFYTGLTDANNNPVYDWDAPKYENNVDTDFLTTKTYAISLEKFISKVNDENITDDRSGKRDNEDLGDDYDAIKESFGEDYANEVKNPYKKENQVEVETGDKVTFTIRLKNTGDAPTKVKYIYDVFRDYKNRIGETDIQINGSLKLVPLDNEGNTIGTSDTGKIIATSDGKDGKGYTQGKFTQLLDYRGDNGESNVYKRYKIEFEDPQLINPGEYVDVYVDFKVDVSKENIVYSNGDEQLFNKAGIWNMLDSLENKNGEIVADSDGTDNNRDMDFLKLKTYAVSLQKIVSSVNNSSTGSSFDRWSSWENKENENPSKTGTAYEKYNNPVEVAKGDKVTYAIKVKNDGSTQVRNIVIQDTLPTSGIDTSTFKVEDVKKYNLSGIEMNNDITTTADGTTLTLTGVLNSKESVIVYVSATVTESNMSLNALRNYAEITGIQNKNNIDVPDTTPNNNQDADYIQMKDITISGTVWNDKALNKTQDNYNGQYDNGQEDKLSNIKVYLYRDGVTDAIVSTYTDNKGNYSFALDYIKGPKVSSTVNRWAGTYYSYYVVFEYDGITYTSTIFADVTSNNSLDSNAKEDGEKVKESRATFNSRFSTINNASEITYITKNEYGYIPQSNHVYNASTMAMQSSTNIINLSNDDNLVSQLQHVNLGLRGRDIFDLELTSDVYSTRVTVNNQSGEYNYNSNKVTVRKSDISVAEDAANFASEARDAAVSEVNQGVRKTDIENNNYDVNNDGQKGDTGLGIEVTYKITVTNASRTDGTATKVTNYYDSKYEFVKAYSGASDLTTSEGDSGTEFKSVVIKTPATNLSQGQSMDIYVVYRLKDASNTLRVLLGDGEKRLATYNMAEVTEYKTFKTTYADGTDNEVTRGLIDKDSAPGSANTEQVRLVPNTIGTSTTVQYYFGGNDLSKLKYEDDTYATPTLYFVSSDNSRTISGIAFEDYISINSNRVKSGNGIKDSTEPTIKGITVELIEGSTVRYTTTTDENGKYQFKDFLPGNYTIKYYYGDTEVTFLKTEPNEESYNGEDFQATNNSYDVSEIGVHKLSTRGNFWYLENESQGVSTGTDDETRRNTVSGNVTGFTDDQMAKLNKIRDGEQLTEIGSTTEEGSLIEQTYMYANTKNMLFTVEKSEINGREDVIQKSQFGTYTISNMNFGIAEVPVTKIDLQKHVQSFEIKDSTGNNTIASASRDASGQWKLKGDVLAPEGANTLDVSIEDEKLQGARLQVTYEITSEIDVEKNFDGKVETYATITELIDYIDNNLSYNDSLGRNSEFWEVTERNTIFTDSGVQGTVDPEGKLYTTIVKAKAGNPILKSNDATATITLEKVLSSTDSTLEEIITSTVDIYEYNNTVEITGINYSNTLSDKTSPRKDLIRTPDRDIIIPKVQNDSTSSEIITIHPPTGDSSINIMYYVITAISLVILAVGTFGIRKFVEKKNKE